MGFLTTRHDIIMGSLVFTYNEKHRILLGKPIPNNEIFRRLAEKMGFKDEQFKWSDEQMPRKLCCFQYVFL